MSHPTTEGMDLTRDPYGLAKLRRAFEDSQHRTGMVVGLPKVTIDASHVNHALAYIDAMRVELQRLRSSGGAEDALDYKLPCEVRLPPATTFGVGVSLRTVVHGMKRRTEQHPAKFPDSPDLSGITSPFQRLSKASSVSPEPGGKSVPDDVRAALEEYNSLLRTFHSIAERKGAVTLWEGLAARIKAALDKHHATWLRITNPPDTPVEAQLQGTKPDGCKCDDASWGSQWLSICGHFVQDEDETNYCMVCEHGKECHALTKGDKHGS